MGEIAFWLSLDKGKIGVDAYIVPCESEVALLQLKEITRSKALT